MDSEYTVFPVDYLEDFVFLTNYTVERWKYLLVLFRDYQMS